MVHFQAYSMRLHADRLEGGEALLAGAASGGDLQHVEAHSLAQGPGSSSSTGGTVPVNGRCFGNTSQRPIRHHRVGTQRSGVQARASGRWGNKPALADGHVVTLLHAEARRDVGGDVRVPLLVPIRGTAHSSVPMFHGGGHRAGPKGWASSGGGRGGHVAAQGRAAVPLQLLDEVQVVDTHDERPLHLEGLHMACA